MAEFDLDKTLAMIKKSWEDARKLAEIATTKANEDHRKALATIKQNLEHDRDVFEQAHALALKKHESKQKATPEDGVSHQMETPAQEILRLKKEIAELKQKQTESVCKNCSGHWGYMGCSNTRCPMATRTK